MGWKTFIAFILGFLILDISFAAEAPKAIPVPKEVRVEASAPRAQIWERLSPKQKQMAYHLIQASNAGRLLLFNQSHRHSLEMRVIFQKAFAAKNAAATKKMLGEEGYKEMLLYAAKFLDQSGPYSGSNRKMILTKVTADQADKFIKKYSQVLPAERTEIAKLLTDPNHEVLQYPESPVGEGLELIGGNLYQKGTRGEDVRAVLDRNISSSLNTTLNCLVRRNKKNELVCEKQTVNSPGVIGKSLKQVVAHLSKALPLAETPEQKLEIEKMLKYFRTGDIEDFRQANIAWVKDRSSSTVDFMMGWVEVYEDWLARMASWESYVQVVDPEVSQLSQKLARKAQHFEDAMPYGKFKKVFPPDYSPPALMVYYLQEVSSYRTAGYNLPNFDDIRKNVGAKNVIRLPLPGEDEDPAFKAMWREVLQEYALNSQVDSLIAAREKVWRVLVLLHEIIGHGSGTYEEAKFKAGEDPVSALGSLGSALEEQRADLAALVFANDPALVEVGLYTNQEEANRFRNLTYDFYVVDFLKRISKLRTFTEAHQRGHWLFVKRLLDEKAIQWVAKDGKSDLTPRNGVLVVKDYDKYQKIARETLEELQNIKAKRQSEDLVKMFAKDAPLDAIDQPWAQAIIERGENLKINAGYIEQPWKITEKLAFKTFGGTTVESVAAYWKDQY